MIDTKELKKELKANKILCGEMAAELNMNRTTFSLKINNDKRVDPLSIGDAEYIGKRCNLSADRFMRIFTPSWCNNATEVAR